MSEFACLVRERGAPDVIRYEAVDVPSPAAGQVRVRHTAIGVNFIDVLMRRGSGIADPPLALGFEAAGVVAAVGPDVNEWRVGDRVGTVNAGPGAYSTARNVAADRLVRLPDHIADDAAASILFKGLTAQYLVRRTHPVQRGDIVVVHAAAGGVGSLLAAWAKHLGAFVIGAVGSGAKRAAALAAGCDVVVDLSSEDLARRVAESTDGRKAHVVYDSVGKDTFDASISSLAPFGLLVIYGGASGPALPVDPELLNQKGGLFLTRPSIFTHNAKVAALHANASELFAAIAEGAVKPRVSARFALHDAAQAHRAIEARSTTGAIVLIP